MKTVPLFLALASTAMLSAQATFTVCDVVRADTALPTIPYRDAAAFLAERDQANYDWIRIGQGLSDSGDTMPTPSSRLEAYGRQTYELVPTRGSHPFVVAAYQAYAQHRPLALSPDMIWLLILQGFATHVDANAEALRHHFVQHEGRRVLNIRRDDYVRGDSLFPWPEVFGGFRDQISAYTNESLVPLVSAEFSTTTDAATRAAFEVTLMDAMSSYFQYTLSVLCGIPEITLEGTPQDWADLERRTAELGQYELTWWTEELRPILREFTLASQGQVNQEFWRDFFQHEIYPDGCTSVDYLTGWIVKFFPYLEQTPNPWVTKPQAVAEFYAALEEGKRLAEDPQIQEQLASIHQAEDYRWSTKSRKSRRAKKNPVEQPDWEEVQALARRVHPEPTYFDLPGIELSDLPMGLSKADLLLDYLGTRLAYQLQAGFIGIRQDEQTLALRPEISWLVIDTGKAPTAEDEELYNKWLEKQQDTVERD